MWCSVVNRALSLEGNNLQCEGAIQLIKPFAEQALLEAQKRADAVAAAVSADKLDQDHSQVQSE